ncbi:MAG TPA: SCO family protein [Myxococcota bacterium]
MRTPVLSLCLAVLMASVSGCDSDTHAERLHEFEVRGIVQDVDPEHGQALIDHEEIPGLMPAMTMSYDVPDPKLLAKLAAGQRVLFTLEIRDKSFRIVNAEVLEEKAAPGRAGALSAVVEDLAPEFALTDQGGAEVTLASLRGKTLLIDFIYTRCPGPCPILTGRHAQLQRELAPELRARVHFVSITVDPEHDTPAALASYARARGADLAGWSFLTGDPARVRDVLKRYGVFAQASANPGEVDHVVVTLLVDAEGRVVKRLFGVEDGVADVKRELEAAAG